MASYFAPNGNYAADSYLFATAGFGTGPLRALAAAAAEGNGVYQYGPSSSFPTGSYRSTDYWVDVVFVAA